MQENSGDRVVVMVGWGFCDQMMMIVKLYPGLVRWQHHRVVVREGGILRLQVAVMVTE